MKKGFTLIELTVTIIILGILILIAIPTISITLRNSREKTFKVTCDKVFGMDEKYELYQELMGQEISCVVFDFENKEIPVEGMEIDGEWYEPLSKIGLENEEGLTGQYRICKNKQLTLSNGEFTCVYDKNNNKILKTTGKITIPILLGAQIEPDTNKITVTILAEGDVDKYYFKIDDKKFISSKEAAHIFENLKEGTEYTITVYVESKEKIKSEEKTYKVITKKSYIGIPKGNYEPGDVVVYDNIPFLVVNDNGDNVTLITKYNQETNNFGETSSWNDSIAKEYLNYEWANSHDIIKDDIELGGIIYNDESSSYIRMIKRDELSNNIPNGSNTPFWTMTSDGNDVYYGLKDGSKQYVKKSLDDERDVITLYVGEGKSLDDIKRNVQVDRLKTENYDAKTSPMNYQAQTSSSASTRKTGSYYYGSTSYKTERRSSFLSLSTRPYLFWTPSYSCITSRTYNTRKRTFEDEPIKYIDSTYTTETEVCVNSKCTSSTFVSYKTTASNCTKGHNDCHKAQKTSACGTGGGNCKGWGHACTDKRPYSCPGGTKGNMDCTDDVVYSCDKCTGGYNPVTTKYCTNEEDVCDYKCDEYQYYSSAVSKCAADGYECIESTTQTKKVVTKVCTPRVKKSAQATRYSYSPVYSSYTLYMANSTSSVPKYQYIISDSTDILGIRAVITVKENSLVSITN